MQLTAVHRHRRVVATPPPAAWLIAASLLGPAAFAEEPPGDAPFELTAEEVAARRTDFDFMLGRWINVGEDGERGGYAEWRHKFGPGSFEQREESRTWYGHAFVSFADRDPRPQWIQSWVDGPFEKGAPGYHLTFRGGLEDGRMVLYQVGEYYEGDRAPENLVTARQIFEPRDDGTVQYTWQISHDDGKTWETTSRSTYVPFFE